MKTVLIPLAALALSITAATAQSEGSVPVNDLSTLTQDQKSALVAVLSGLPGK